MIISNYRKGAFKVLDALCIITALGLSSLCTLPSDLSVFDDYTGASLFTVIFYLFFFYVLDAYKIGAEDFRDTVGRVLVAFVLGAIASATAFYAFENWRFDRATLFLLFALCLIFCLGWRTLYYRHIGRFVHRPQVLLIGRDQGGKVQQSLAESMTDAVIVGYVGEPELEKVTSKCPDEACRRQPGLDENCCLSSCNKWTPHAGIPEPEMLTPEAFQPVPNNGESPENAPIPYLGTPLQVAEIARQYAITMIVLLPNAPIDDDIASELLQAKLKGQMIVDVRSFCEHMVHRLPVSQISSEWLLTEDGFSLNTRGSLRRLKRAIDLVASLALVVVTSPIVALACLGIRLESAGPIIYSQRRVGLFGNVFTVHKLRSMHTDAEKDGAVWATKSDPRVTKVGRFIRKTRIDELPQLWNVLKGDMSLIGPRPERPEFVAELEQSIPFYSLRHSVKPGVTGWAQVCYPYGSSVNDARRKLEFDLYYVKNMSLLLDIRIVFKTMGVILFPKGAL